MYGEDVSGHKGRCAKTHDFQIFFSMPMFAHQPLVLGNEPWNQILLQFFQNS